MCFSTCRVEILRFYCSLIFLELHFLLFVHDLTTIKMPSYSLLQEHKFCSYHGILLQVIAFEVVWYIKRKTSTKN